MITQTPIRFESVFADELTKYIKYKRSLGMQYDRPEYELVTFSKFLADNNVSEMTISKEIAEKWCCRRVDEGHKMWANRTGIYRQFAIYLNKNGYSAYIPPTPQRYITEYIPYIFTKEEILNITELSMELIDFLCHNYSSILNQRYGVDETRKKAEILEEIAINRQCRLKGNQIDYDKAAGILMDEFRSGKLGAITLEFVKKEENANSETV